MDTIEKIMTAVLAVGAAAEIYMDIKLYLLMRKTKELAVTVGLYELLWVLFLTLGVTISYMGGNISLVLLIMFYLVAVFCLPLQCDIFTPEGLLRVGLKNKSGIDPADKYSYKYVQGKVIKESLLLYREGAEKPHMDMIGVKNPRLISMLNANYKKHGYENPMLKE